MAGARSGSRSRAGGGARSGSRSGSGSRAGSGSRSAPPRALQLLWAPWRLENIEAPRPPGCIFCDYPADRSEGADRRNLLAHRADRSFTLLNRFPYNSGHVMVVPLAHVSRLDDLSPEDFADLHAELRRAVGVLRDVYRPQGFNVGMNLGTIAGAGIADHLHYHVVPRWAGDTSFMPVVSDTKVMIEHLDASWEKIHRGFGG